MRWSLRTDDLDADAARQGLRAESRSRPRPDGVRITRRTVGLDLALRQSWLPFFRAWDNPEQYP